MDLSPCHKRLFCSCGADSPRREVDRRPSVWKCPTCTYQNKSTNLKCEMWVGRLFVYFSLSIV